MHWLVYGIGIVILNIAKIGYDMPWFIYWFFLVGLVICLIYANIQHVEKKIREEKRNGYLEEIARHLSDIKRQTKQVEKPVTKMTKEERQREIGHLLDGIPDDEPYELADNPA